MIRNITPEADLRIFILVMARGAMLTVHPLWKVGTGGECHSPLLAADFTYVIIMSYVFLRLSIEFY